MAGSTRTRILAVVITLLCCAGPAPASEYIDLGLFGRVQAADLIVIARIVDPATARVTVERTFKGSSPRQITLVKYVDGFAAASTRKPLIAGQVELMFLTTSGDAYAPVQTEYGRMPIRNGALIDSFRTQPRRLAEALTTIQRLVTLQARAAGSPADADAASLAALRSRDDELKRWALWQLSERVKAPSPALVSAVMACWPSSRTRCPGLYAFSNAGLVANIMSGWRLPDTAPFFAKELTSSADDDRRGYAAMALGGSGNRAYLPLLRRVAATDTKPFLRQMAYSAIMDMLGPEAFADLRTGATDPDPMVRAQAVCDVYNMLELETDASDRRWPPPSDALVVEVRAFLTKMERDPASLVSTNARGMLGYLAARGR